MKDVEDIAKEKYPDTIFPKENDIEISPLWVLVNLRQAFISGSQYAPLLSESDMTVQDFYSGFNLDFLSEEERQTIYTATELYAKGKLRLQEQELQARGRRVAAEAWDAADRYVSMLNHGSKEFQPNKEQYINSLINK